MNVQVEGRSVVWKSEWAQFASGSHDFATWDSPILRGPLRYQGRGTTVRPLRAMLGLEVLTGAVAVIVPGCAALGSAGGRHPRRAVNVGVGVWVVGPVRWGRGRCFPRTPLTLGVLSVSRGGPTVVLTSGGLTHGVLVSSGVTQNTTNTNYLAVCSPRVSEFPECRKDQGM